MAWVRGRRPEVVLVVLLCCSIFLYSAWFYGWHTQLGDSLSDYYASDDNDDNDDHDHSSSSPEAPKPVPWYPSLNRTHEALLAAHRNYTAKLAGEVLCSPDQSLRLRAAAHPRRWLDQTRSLEWLFEKKVSPAVSADGVQLLTCGHFDPACARWTDRALTELYDLHYVPPDFVPSVEAVRKHYEEPSVMNAAQAGNQAEVKRLRKVPDNTGLPQVGVVLDGFVTPRGSIFSRDFFIPCAIAEEFLHKDGDKAGFPSTYEYLACNRKKLLPKLVVVREVAVIYHLHHNMFYHMVQDQYYRLLALLPYLRQHPDIHILIYGWSDSKNWDGTFGDRFFQFCGISKSRVIFSGGENGDVSVKADVIYYVQDLSRHEPSALGFAQQIRSQFWNLLALPDHRPWSALLEPAKRGQVEAFFGVGAPALTGTTQAQAVPTPAPGYEADHPLEVNIVVMVRTDHWRGRLIVNHEAMKTALLELAVTFPAELLKRTKAAVKKSEAGDDERTEVERRERYVKINYKEHCPKTPLHETLALYAQADFVIGPHGAGFVFLAATRPGVHVVEFVGGYEQNMMTTARLGSAYHGVVANFTKEGLMKGSDGFDYVVDVPHLIGLVTSVLESRFLGTSPPAAPPR